VNIEQWRKRIKKLEGNGHDLVLKTIEKVVKEHGKCCENVCDAISTWFAKYATDGRVSYVEAVRLNRMLELIDCINEDLESVTEEEDKHLELLVAALLGLYSKKLEIDFTLDTLKTQWIMEGIWYSDNLKENKTLLLFYIRNDLKQAIARGDKLPEILTQVRKRFKTSSNSLGSLIQTRCTDYESDIMKNWLIATGHSKYVWITIQDGRQCDDCDVMDGLIFDVKDYERGVTAPTLHRNCRCQIAPAD
jgi:SPP1 gp7 family putative phage head morphogenesis protein